MNAYKLKNSTSGIVFIRTVDQGLNKPISQLSVVH